MDGYEKRQESQAGILAYFCAHVLNVEGKSLKRPITPQKLLEGLIGKKQVEKSAEEEAELRKLFAWKFEDGD